MAYAYIFRRRDVTQTPTTFYKIYFGEHKSFLWGLSGFQGQGGFLRFTSGVTPADLLTASMTSSRIPYMHVAEVGCLEMQDSIRRSLAQ